MITLPWKKTLILLGVVVGSLVLLLVNMPHARGADCWYPLACTATNGNCQCSNAPLGICGFIFVGVADKFEKRAGDGNPDWAGGGSTLCKVQIACKQTTENCLAYPEEGEFQCENDSAIATHYTTTWATYTGTPCTE